MESITKLPSPKLQRWNADYLRRPRAQVGAYLTPISPMNLLQQKRGSQNPSPTGMHPFESGARAADLIHVLVGKRSRVNR